MNALDLLLNRRSASQKVLGLPAPDDEQLQTLLQAAVSVPDHGRLRPWRFIVFKSEQLHALGALFAKALKQREGDSIDAKKLEAYSKKPLRAPLIIGVVSCIQEQSKIPKQEQLMSASLAAQHIQLAAQAMGFSSIWLSGINCFDTTIRDGLSIQQNEEVIAYLYIGTETSKGRAPKRPDAMDFVTFWHADNASEKRDTSCG